MCSKQFSVYANASRHERVYWRTLNFCFGCKKLAFKFRKYSSNDSRASWWKDEGRAQFWNETNAQNIAVDLITLAVQIGGSFRWKIRSWCWRPTTQSLSPVRREQHAVLSNHETGVCLCEHYATTSCLLLSVLDIFCIRSISVCVATVCLCCCIKFGWEDRTAVLDVWMWVYSCAEADKPSSREAGIRCMLISRADSLLLLTGAGPQG